MKIFFTISIFLLVLYSCNSVEKYNAHINQVVTTDALKKDVDFAKNKLLKKHVDIDWYHPKEVIAFRLDSFKNTINDPMLPNDFSKQLTAVMSSFGHAHLHLTRLEDKLTKEQKKKYKGSKNPLSLLKFKNAENRIYLEQNFTKNSSIITRAELLAIDGFSFADFLKDNPKIRRGDGYTNVLNQNYIAPYFLSFIDNKLKIRDSIVLTLQKNDSVFNQVVKREFKKKFEKNTFKKNDSVQEKNNSNAHQPKKKLTKEEKLRKREIRKNKYEIERYYAYDKSKKKYNRELRFPNSQDSTTVILDVNSFSLGHHKEAYDHIFDSIHRLGTKNLILDLRENGGGLPEDINHLFAHLTTKNVPQMVVSPMLKVRSKWGVSSRYFSKPNIIGHTILLPLTMYRTSEAFFKSKKIDGEYYYNGSKKKDFILKEKNRFEGNLYVLTSGKTYSAASLIASALHAEGKAVIVGEETGGDYNGTVAGYYENYKLPNSKIKIRIPMMVFQNNEPRELKGRGVIPNQEIKYHFSDFMNQKDPQIDWILKDIESKK